MLTVTFILLIAAFLTVVAAMMNKCPLYVSVLLLCILELVQILPK